MKARKGEREIMRVARYFIAILFCCLSFIFSFAQDESKKAEATTPVKDSANAAQDLMRLNVLVLDKKGQPVMNLSKTDFSVFDENQKQEITSFVNETQPLLMGIALDASGSLRTQFNSISNAYGIIINNLTEKDEAFSVKFIDKDKYSELQDFTNEKRRLISGFDDYFVEGGQTALYDAVYQSAEKLANYRIDENRLRVLIIITDGDESKSVHSEEETLKFLREAGVQVFIVGLVQALEHDSGFTKSKREKAMSLLDKLANETGGRSFYPRISTDIPALIRELIRNLRSQYTIGFIPTDRQKNKYRKLRVEVTESQGRERLKVITRTGYIVK